jgi:hypothetical protein
VDELADQAPDDRRREERLAGGYATSAPSHRPHASRDERAMGADATGRTIEGVWKVERTGGLLPL